MPGSNQPKRQHYINQAYLEGFLDPTQEKKRKRVLWVYEAQKDPFPSSPSNCAVETKFYLIEVPGKEYVVEQTLSKMEDQILPTMRDKLGNGVFSVTNQERSEFATFIALMCTRVPFFLNKTDEFSSQIFSRVNREIALLPGGLEQLVKKHEEETGEIINTSPAELRSFILSGDYTVKQVSRGWTIKMMFETAIFLTPIIEEMKWTLLRADNDELFLTSDNPVALADPSNPAGPAFFSSENAQFTLPINRRYCLYCGWKGGDEVVGLTNSRVRQVNSQTISRCNKYVYASEKSHKLKKFIDKVCSGKLHHDELA